MRERFDAPAADASLDSQPLSAGAVPARRYNGPMASSYSRSAPLHALVVGGGIVGKTAALALSHAGVRVGLLAPRAPVASATLDSRVYALSASSQALLERLRVWQALDHARLGPVHRMQVSGDGAGCIEFTAYQAAVPQLAWIVESLVIERSLDAALGFQPQCVWKDGRAAALSIGEDYASVTLDTGETMDAELVVGADGAHSWVRSQTEARVSTRPYGQTGVVANFRAREPNRETASQWFRDGEVIALLPLPDNHVSLVWSAADEHARALLALDGTTLAARVEQASGGLLGELECVTPARGFPLVRQTVSSITAPRVALVGDAAHVIHPLAGQGMNLGLRDVAALADILAGREAHRGLADPVLLRRYARARADDILRLVTATDGLHRLFATRAPLAGALRNFGLSLVNAQPFLKQILVGHALG
jgi:2-octaprenylphenol hydroxylase